MNYLCPKLKYRIEIRKGEQTPNTDGGFDRSYTTLKTIWAEIKEAKKGLAGFIEAIRGEIVSNSPSHEFIVRFSSVKSLGKTFSSSFSSDFDSIEDLNPLKSDHFIYLKAGSNKGRLFKITGTKRDEKNKEYFSLMAKEIEEIGTGYSL